MPESAAQNFMSEPKRLRGLPLCFYGCPRTATMKPKSSESSSVSARSASPPSSASSTNNNYYKSQCPNPELVSEEEDLPQADASVPSPIPNTNPNPLKPEEAEFSGSLSAEFLSQSSSFANTDFGGQRSQRSHSSSTAVICASLNNVHTILSDTTVVGQKLTFPGDDHFIESVHHRHHPQDNSFVSFSSAALTSQSAPSSRFHFVFVYLTVVLIFGWGSW